MEKKVSAGKFLSFCACFLFLSPAYPQDTSLTFTIDTSFLFSLIEVKSYSFSDYPEYMISHNPTHQDSLFCENHSDLIPGKPTSENYDTYYTLAESLWNLGRVDEAEEILLEIIASKEPFYEDQKYHSSDIAGDTGTNMYGYGSYSENYKNYACRILAKIYIEKKQFDLALQYIHDADNKYEVSYGCGTGYMWYRSVMDGLYVLACEGADRYNEIIDKFLPEYHHSFNSYLTRAVKKVYAPEEIQKQLNDLAGTLTFITDTCEPHYIAFPRYGHAKEIKVFLPCDGVTATVKLFGKEFNLFNPWLKDGGTITKLQLTNNNLAAIRELYLKEFRGTEFYSELTNYE